MYIQPVYSISFLVITFLLSFFFVKRLSKKGCATFAYVSVGGNNTTIPKLQEIREKNKSNQIPRKQKVYLLSEFEIV